MRAVVIRGPRDIGVKEVLDPKCNDDSILIRIHRASVCSATDYEIYQGTNPSFKYEWMPNYPHILGHESCGEVVEIGDNVKGYQLGDRIAYWWVPTGSFAEYLAINPEEYAMTKLPDNVSYDEGSLMEPLTATLRAVYSADLRPGDEILILGQGAMGLLVTQEVKAFGAHTVVTTDLSDFRLDKSRQLGADLTLNPKRLSEAAMMEKIRDEVGEIDIVFDTIGIPCSGKGVDLGINILKEGGTYVLYGILPEQVTVNHEIFHKGVQIKTPSNSMERIKRLIKVGAGLVSRGIIKLDALITHHIKLEDIEKGLELCKKAPNKVIKVVIDITESN